MQFRILATSALVATMIAGCASQEKPDDMAAQKAPEPAPAKTEPAKPKLQMGANDSMLANTCAGCHGTHGNSHGPSAPTIAGMEADYLLETMQAYKSGDRSGTIMGRIVKGYTDGELEQIANFYSKQSFQGWTQAAVGPKAKQGHMIHENFCEKCHEDGGTSVEDVALAGQWMPYISQQMKEYTSGKRPMTKKMKKKFEKLNDADKENIVHYYGSFQ